MTAGLHTFDEIQEVDEEAANEIIAILLWMRQQDSYKTISIYFNVPGALLRPALAIYDLIEQTKETCEIETVNPKRVVAGSLRGCYGQDRAGGRDTRRRKQENGF